MLCFSFSYHFKNISLAANCQNFTLKGRTNVQPWMFQDEMVSTLSLINSLSESDLELFIPLFPFI